MENVERFRKIAGELGDLYEKKDKCYNNSFGDTFNKLGIISAVTRISDKYNRLCNLATNPNIDDLDESLQDTLCDMACYCIMTIMELENAKPIGLNMQNVVMREYITDSQIHKGDVFKCVQNVYMDDDSIAYFKGKTYISVEDGCITDEENQEFHHWGIQDNEKDNWWHYFKRI